MRVSKKYRCPINPVNRDFINRVQPNKHFWCPQLEEILNPPLLLKLIQWSCLWKFFYLLLRFLSNFSSRMVLVRIWCRYSDLWMVRVDGVQDTRLVTGTVLRDVLPLQPLTVPSHGYQSSHSQQNRGKSVAD